MDAKNLNESETMEQVRDLLFGSQMKEIDIKIQRNNEELSVSMENLKGMVKQRLDSVENFMKSEVESLLNKIYEEQNERKDAIKAEQKERTDTFNRVSAEIAGSIENADKKYDKITAKMDSLERELRNLLLSENGVIADKVQEKYDDVLVALNRMSEQIRADMVHRNSLANLFTEVSLRINGQLDDINSN